MRIDNLPRLLLALVVLAGLTVTPAMPLSAAAATSATSPVAAAVVKVPTKVTGWRGGMTIRRARAIKVSGPRGRRVKIQKRADGKWRTIRVERTNRKRRVNVSRVLRTDGKWRLRVPAQGRKLAKTTRTITTQTQDVTPIAVASGKKTTPTTKKPGQIKKSPTPTPTPTATPTPMPSGFPGEATTGVPGGVALRPSGSLTVTVPGTVIDGLHVSGSITIAANDVTIRRTLVQSTARYRIHVKSGTTGTLIEDVEIDAMNSLGKGMLVEGSATVRRVNLHGSEDGIFLQADGVFVEDSYVHHLYMPPGGHVDCVQIRKGDNVTLRGNNLQAFNPSANNPMNASIQVGSLNGTNQISNFLVEGNLMNGGNYTVNAGGRGETDSSLYRNNRFGRDYRYGVVGNLNSADVWESSNVYLDDGQTM